MPRSMHTLDRTPRNIDAEGFPPRPDAADEVTEMPHFLSPDTVAGILRVNRKTVYAAIASGALKARRFGRILRIPTAAILELARGALPLRRRRQRS